MGWADVPARNKHGPVTVHLHSNQVIIFLLAERAQCTFCMQEDEQQKEIRCRGLTCGGSEGGAAGGC
jgi:hypothetical protein